MGKRDIRVALKDVGITKTNLFMKMLKYFVMALFAVAIVSCGGKKNSSDENSTSDSVEPVSTSDVSDLNVSDDSEDENETSLSASSSDSEDFDAVLESYEEYVDQYIVLMKKAAKGDMSAMSEYPTLMEKAQELGEKMENAKGDMSASQLAKYQKITMKMAEAAQNMQK